MQGKNWKFFPTPALPGSGQRVSDVHSSDSQPLLDIKIQ